MKTVIAAALLAVSTSATPCTVGSTYEWCDAALPIDQRVSALVANLSVVEKSVLLSNGAGAVDRVGIKAYNWWSEALHGVARDGVATSFPQIIGTSSSFNRTLWHATGQATGVEARGKNNALAGGMYQGLTLWAPNVNLFRDPRWGRGQETPGEDPKENGEYAIE